MYEKYTDGFGQWRWRYVAGNGRIISVASEAYVLEADCDRSIQIMKASSSAPVMRR